LGRKLKSGFFITGYEKLGYHSHVPGRRHKVRELATAEITNSRMALPTSSPASKPLSVNSHAARTAIPASSDLIPKHVIPAALLPSQTSPHGDAVSTALNAEKTEFDRRKMGEIRCVNW
jgi:hypothetical protein